MSRACIKADKLRKHGCPCCGKTFNTLLEWKNDNPHHVYIGRNMEFYVAGSVESKWKNPYPVKKFGRDGCIKKYKEYIQSTPALMNSLGELRGCTLGCWCVPDEACHADVLIELINIL